MRSCLVVEDEIALGEMICDNLSLESYATELVRSGSEALDRLARGGIDLVILDIMLPVIDGFTVLEEMRKRGDNTPVLIVSARSSDADRIHGLELKADDYLTKPFNLRELLLRVDALLRRHPPAAVEPKVLEFAGNRVDFGSHRARTWTGREEELTATELKLLRLLSSRDGVVVNRKEIVDHLFGPTTPVTTRTLDNLVLRLRKLFERATQQPQHLHTIRGVGLRFTKREDRGPTRQ